jgi:nucleoside-diphosphate-sugar epimerase
MGSHLKILDGNGVQGIEADLLDHHSLHEAMEGVDVVYNLASPTPWGDDDFMKLNTEGILNLVEVAKESKVKVFLHLSCLDLYGFNSGEVARDDRTNPSGDYQRSKAEAERLLQEFSKRNGTPRILIFRAAKAVGSRDEAFVVPLIRMINDGKVLVPDLGEMSFSHPLDIAQAMYKASSSSSQSGSVYLVKSFDSSPHSLAKGLSSALGKEARMKNPGIFGAGLLPKYSSDQLKARLRIQPQPNWKEIGYDPAYSVTRTCEEIATWYKKEPWAAEAQ